MLKHVFAAACIAATAAAAARPAQAQQGCLGPDRLSIQFAQTRPGSGGTWNYVARVANSSMQAIRFDLRFQMVNVQPNREIAGTQTLNSRTFRDFVLGNGPSVIDGSRIADGTRLICR